jgi:carbon starvation protein CstA
MGGRVDCGCERNLRLGHREPRAAARDIVFGEYLLYVYDRTGRQLIPWVVVNQICAAVQLAAVVCGLIAMRRGSKWWGLIVAPALWFAFVCYLNDL